MTYRLLAFQKLNVYAGSEIFIYHSDYSQQQVIPSKTEKKADQITLPFFLCLWVLN